MNEFDTCLLELDFWPNNQKGKNITYLIYKCAMRVQTSCFYYKHRKRFSLSKWVKYVLSVLVDDQEHEWIVRTCRKSWDEFIGRCPRSNTLEEKWEYSHTGGPLFIWMTHWCSFVTLVRFSILFSFPKLNWDLKIKYFHFKNIFFKISDYHYTDICKTATHRKHIICVNECLMEKWK